MTITTAQAPFTREHFEITFYLCSRECAAKFDADADAYAVASKLSLPGWGQTSHPPNVVAQFRSKPEEK